MRTQTTDTTHRKRPAEHRHARGEMQRCPLCQLTIRRRYPSMELDYCPRCIALTRELVPLLSCR
jgi:hypothetical protein